MKNPTSDSQIRHSVARDGVRIGWRQLGTGPAVVVSHGSVATGEQWLGVARALADKYTFYLVDRRGRGLSGDAAEHRLDMEVGDLEAVLAVAGPGATLLGHSYGAICAAATAVAGRADFSTLVLYEPPLPVKGPISGPALPRIAAAIAGGENERALTLALSECAGLPDLAIAAIRQDSHWAEMVALAPTWERELRAVDALTGALDYFTTIPHRTLLLLGLKSAQSPFVDATRYLLERLPRATLAELPDGDHYAHVSDPVGVADAVRSFLR